LANGGEAAAAAQGFRELKPTLRTQSARNEIDWRLAQAEYQIGDREQAADRLQALVQRLELGSDGAPADSTNQRYLDTYGTICLNLGRRMRGEDLRTSLKYLKQSAEVSWKQRALAELEVGRLLRNDVETSIAYLERAADRDSGLGTKNRLQLYRTLVNQHRRLGHREEAIAYRKEFTALRRKARASK
jgi:predicted Zn-dependent protease